MTSNQRWSNSGLSRMTLAKQRRTSGCDSMRKRDRYDTADLDEDQFEPGSRGGC